MAAVTTGRASPGAVAARGRRADITGTLRSEFTKIRSVRSTYWMLFMLVVAGIAWSVAFCAGEAFPLVAYDSAGPGGLRPDASGRRTRCPPDMLLVLLPPQPVAVSASAASHTPAASILLRSLSLDVVVFCMS